jgi:hypothetical protein
MKVALYASNHGFGHASRISALASSFIDFGVYVYVCTDRPAFLFKNLRENAWEYRECKLDRGVVHKENLVTDPEATKKAILDLFSHREELVGKETIFLRENQIDFVVADIPYFVVEACRYASIPVFGISNFDWFFIYNEIFRNDPDLKPVLNIIWALYRGMDKSYLVDLGSKRSVPGFRDVSRSGLIAREAKKYHNMHHKLGIDPEAKILLLMFGGEGNIDIPIESICKAWDGVVVSPYKMHPAGNLITVEPDEDFLSLMHDAELIICKPGYSTFAEVMSLGKSMIYIPRKNYPEEEFLINGVQDYPGALMVEKFPNEPDKIREIFQKAPVRNEPRQTVNKALVGDLINDFIRIKHAQDRIITVIDMGSNNLNYSLFNKSKNQIIHRHWCTTALALGFTNGSLAASGIKNALDSLDDILAIDGRIESEKKLIATGISRKAENAPQIIEQIKVRYGISAKIISAKAEMKYGWWAAKEYRDGSRLENMIMDIGGASTELSWENTKGYIGGLSLDIGLVSLWEAETAGADVWELIQKAYTDLPDRLDKNLIVVGLTATILSCFLKNKGMLEALSINFDKVSVESLLPMIEAIQNGNIQGYRKISESDREIQSMRIAVIMIKLLLDRYQLSYFVVCNDGISIGYAKWMK